LFEAPLLLQEFVTESWFKQTWQMTSRYNIHLQIDIPDFMLQCINNIKRVKLFLCNAICQPQLQAYTNAKCSSGYYDYQPSAPEWGCRFYSNAGQETNQSTHSMVGHSPTDPNLQIGESGK